MQSHKTKIEHLGFSAAIYVCTNVYAYCNIGNKEEFLDSYTLVYAHLHKVFTQHFIQDLSVNRILSINFSKFLCPCAIGLNLFFLFRQQYELRFLHPRKQGKWRYLTCGTLYFDSCTHRCQNTLIAPSAALAGEEQLYGPGCQFCGNSVSDQ